MRFKKEIFITIVFLLYANIFTAYAGETDTLKSRLESLSGQEKVAVLNELAGAYWELPPNERIVFAEQAVDLSEKFHEYKSKAAAFNHLGVAYNNLGDSPKSMDYFLKALEIMEQIDDKSGIADSYVNLGQANFYLDNFDKALEYFQQSLDLRVELGDKWDLSQSLILIGNVKAKTAQYDEALDYYFKALTIKEEIDDKNGISQIYNNLGNIYFETKQPEKALEYRLKSLQIDREHGNKWEIANTAFNIAEHYLMFKQPGKAFPYILESQEIAEYFDNKGLIRDNLYNFSLYHELRGEYQKALKYQRNYAELTKNLLSKELSEKIAEMQIKYETEKKEIENQAYKLQLEKALSSRLRLILGLLIILIIAFVIYYRYRVKRKSNLLLENLVAERTRELQQKINELKQTKTELQENEQFQTNLFESIQDGVSVLNLDMTIRHVNGVMKQWYAGKLPLEGKLCYQAYHNADKPCDPCPTIRCLESGKTEDDVVSGLPGSPVEFIELFSYPMKDLDSGEITGVVEFVRDITEREKIKQELIDEKIFADTLVQTSPVLFVVIDADGKTIIMNDFMLNMLGYTKDEITGKDYLTSFVPEDDREMLAGVFNKLTSAHQATLNENRILTKDGSKYLVEWHGKPILNEKGEFQYFFGVGIDITERRKSENELRQHREHLEELVKERTAELEEKNAELERFNNLFVDREFRIKELRDRVKELEEKLRV